MFIKPPYIFSSEHFCYIQHRAEAITLLSTPCVQRNFNLYVLITTCYFNGNSA
ncbi:protein of unknown function [Legionella fallonii LLAP-10]|uniref:Uncharacterized protein n=1 Tax=Legionella fallonii LLAP-10 TaxID=1212491 RepID=A0A098G496_9GAMM|nr:protein of unknown function [Legionella fallonii LLAP-10]